MCGDVPCPAPTGGMEPPMCGDVPCPAPTGGMEPPMCGDVPCPTGDDTHTGGAFDCATMPDGSAATPMEIENCEASHADSAHGGMAPATDCAATPGGPEAVAACWDAQAAAGGN